MTTQPKKKRAEDQPLPPDAGQKPIQLQRRRVWRACESCRRKKIKCDGNEPTCTQCATSASQCTWLQTKDRAALSRHYVQELEARLIHMESLFAQIAPILEQTGQLPPGLGADGVVTLPPGGGSGGSLQAIAPATSMRSQLSGSSLIEDRPSPDSEQSVKIEADDDTNEVWEAFGQLALDEHGHMRWIGGSSTMSLINSFRNLTTSPMHRISPMEDDPRGAGVSANKLYFPSSVFFGKVRALPPPEEVEYPERDLADKLIDAYFAKLHFLMPVIDKPSFLAKYKYLMDNTRDVKLHRVETAFIALVFSVFACAARLVDDPRLATKLGESEEVTGSEMGMTFYERALILQYISHASIQVDHVQCLLLMSSFLCSVNCLPQAWLSVGQAVRTAQDLGLHRSPRRLNITPVDKETRRRIWWGVYSMDRMLAVALGRPLGVEDSDCDVEIPVPIDDDDLPAYFEGAPVGRDRPTLMAGFIALTSLYKIAGRVLRQVYAIENCEKHLDPERRADLQRTVESLDRELTKWCDELPVVFKSGPINERDVSMGAVLCSHYYSILTTLHRNFLPVKREPPAVPRSVAKAVSSARACIHLAAPIKNVVPPSHHLAFFIQNLFSSAVIILLYAMHATDAKAASGAMETARSCLVALQSWEGQWPGARKCKELLNELVNTAAEAIKSSSNTNGSFKNTQSNAQGVSPGGPSSAVLNQPGSPRGVSDAWGQPTALQMATGGRAVRNKPRRDRSHDPYTHSRQSSRSGPSIRDSIAQRARSASRKRPYDEPVEGNDGHSTYPSVLPYPTNTGVSSHSSPASVRSLPSPREQPADTLPAQPHRPGSPKVASPTFGMSPMHVPSSPRPFDYNSFLAQQAQALGQPPPSSATQDPWSATSQNGDANGLMFYPSNTGAQDANNLMYGPPSAGLDSFYPYESTDPSSGIGNGQGPNSASSTTPPYANFATPGLPFAGLDYIRNYNPDAYGLGGDESLWQAIDPGAFRYEPDLPWALGDLSGGEQMDTQLRQ